jgi:hypothetical protein
MMEKIIKLITTLAPFLDSYPVWVKAVVFIWIVLSGVLLALLILTRAPATVAADAFIIPNGKYQILDATGFDEAFSEAVLEVDPNVLTLRMKALSGTYSYRIRYLGNRNAIKGEIIAADEPQYIGLQLQGSVTEQGSFYAITINLIESRKVLQLTCRKERLAS